MEMTTLLVYIAMYLYGFPLMLWSIFYDKNPTKLSRNFAIFGLTVLISTVIYLIYVLVTAGLL